MGAITHEEELQEMKNYLHQIFLKPGSGEYALNTILSPGSWAKSPLIHRLPALEVPVAFFFGANDWMDPVPAMYLTENKLLLNGGTLHFVIDADHHMYLDNPTEMVYKMLFEVFGEDIAERYRQLKQNADLK